MKCLKCCFNTIIEVSLFSYSYLVLGKSANNEILYITFIQTHNFISYGMWCERAELMLNADNTRYRPSVKSQQNILFYSILPSFTNSNINNLQFPDFKKLHYLIKIIYLRISYRSNSKMRIFLLLLLLFNHDL